jgi:hypothetical protein
MEHRFDARISRREVARAIRRLVLKILGVKFLLLITVGVCSIAFDLSDGRAGYLTVIVVAIFIVFLLILTFLRNLLMKGLIRGSGSDDVSLVSYRLNDAEIGLSSSFGDSTAGWESITRLWIEPELTILFLDGESCTIIPSCQIPQEALEFLVQQASLLGVPTLNWADKSPTPKIVSERGTSL